MNNTQSNALRLADALDGNAKTNWTREEAAAELRRQHARIAELEAQLEAIGAGGVSGPLLGRAAEHFRDATKMMGRWYMVTHDGVATLCEDLRDAEKEAKDADMAWPHSGPHRAVQLVEASTAGFTAADMATAAAQGFRDGVASVAASAGGEPVAGMNEYGVRGYLAATLKCWHRLTGDEAAELVAMTHRLSGLYLHPSPVGAKESAS